MGALLVVAAFMVVSGFFMLALTNSLTGFVVFWGGVLIGIVAVVGRFVGLL